MSDTNEEARFLRLLVVSRSRDIVLALREAAVSARILESESLSFCTKENLTVSLFSSQLQSKLSMWQ